MGHRRLRLSSGFDFCGCCSSVVSRSGVKPLCYGQAFRVVQDAGDEDAYALVFSVSGFLPECNEGLL